MEPLDILIIGSYVQDLTWNTPAFPSPGETVVGTFQTGPGGKGSNQAVAAGRAGARILYAGAVGADAFATAAGDFYQSEGFQCRLIEKPGHASGTAAILVDETGQNQIIVALGANDALAPEDVPVQTVTSAKILVCQLEANLEATAHYLETAHKAGVTTILNPAPMRPDFDASILAHVDILAPNETEFASIIDALGLGDPGKDPLDYEPAELEALRVKLGLRTLLITLGGRGSLVCEEGVFERVAILEGITAVDTTGAGDAFVGGFAAGLLRYGNDTVQAAQFGNAVAGLSVMKPGTAPSMPSLPEVEAVL